MKTILCFGDSNTWGYAPDSGRRYSELERWPMLLQHRLSDCYQVVEDGKPGRTSIFTDSQQGFVSGRDELLTHTAMLQPDILVLLLGTNDLKSSFQQSAKQIAANISAMIQAVIESGDIAAERVLMLAPPCINEHGHFAAMFAGGEAKSRHFASCYRREADLLGCHFLDGDAHIETGDSDGIHWQASQHQRLAIALTAKINLMMA